MECHKIPERVFDVKSQTDCWTDMVSTQHILVLLCNEHLKLYC